MKIDISADIRGLTRHLDDVQKRQIPFATHRAINDTAFETMHALRDDMPNYVDRPTRAVQRSVVVTRSPNKRTPIAHVHFTDWADEFMSRLVVGGQEYPVRRALLSPVSNQTRFINKFGGLKRKAFNSRMKHQTIRYGKRGGSASTRRYFFGTPKGRMGSNFQGVWERYGRNKRLRQVIHLEQGYKRVTATFPFYKIGQSVAGASFPRHFEARLSQALQTAK